MEKKRCTLFGDAASQTFFLQLVDDIENRDIPDTRHGHMKRPRDRRSGQCEYVDIIPHSLDLLLMVNAEPLLLVYYEKSESAWLNII